MNIYILLARKLIEEKVIDVKKPKIETKMLTESNDEDDDDDEIVLKKKGKRKISCLVDSDSDSDYENDENESDNSQDDIKPARKKSNKENPMAKKKIKLEPKTGSKGTFEEKLKANMDESRALLDVNENESADIVDVPVVYRHQKYDWLKPDNIRDANKRRPDHPQYDPTTLYVPESHLNDLTPVGIICL